MKVRAPFRLHWASKDCVSVSSIHGKHFAHLGVAVFKTPRTLFYRASRYISFTVASRGETALTVY